MVDRSNGVPADGSPEDAAFLALHAERERVERDLVLAQQRQRYGSDMADVVQAGDDEKSLLARLDQVLTQLRAAEYRRQPGARRW
ncbi:hypothetical protein [Methylobacterium sp. Leaf108]|uniref:hypothetical protein n=1 Tax=Methylobacterium sp. Leaf108 TaxID=1736256 RepID=UPI0006FF2723|nr:hypothetical protein [Methylobacterium sp. Leaf108]KQP50344.1 hypothetical protein ASF39_13235 [Methylobacterium sp. Leaf108]